MQIKTVYSEFLFDCEVKHFSSRTMKGYEARTSLYKAGVVQKLIDGGRELLRLLKS